MKKLSNKNEWTSHPYWIIIDPKQNFKTNEDGVHYIAGMITGVFFSRQSAQNHLIRKRHHFSDNAVVYCCSGCYSEDWVEFSKENTEE